MKPKAIEEIREKWIDILYQECDCDYPSDIVNKFLAIKVGGEVYEDVTDPYMGLVHNVRPKTVRDKLMEGGI